ACWLISPWTGSIAGGRWCIVIGLRRAGIGRGLAAASFALRACRGTFLADGDTQPLDPPRIGVEHLDFEIARTRNDFAAYRQAADLRHQIAAQRLDFLARFAGDEFLADHGAGILEA